MATGANLAILPGAVDQGAGDVFGQFIGEDGQCLAFGAGEVGANADERISGGGPVGGVTRGQVARGDLRGDAHAEILHGEDVVWFEVKFVALVFGEYAGDDDVGIAAGGEVI